MLCGLPLQHVIGPHFVAWLRFKHLVRIHIVWLKPTSTSPASCGLYPYF
jgi:hypothetical protein